MVRHCTQCGEPQPGDARFCPKCGTPAVAPGNDPMLGKVVAERYLLVEKIGQGGAGTIYRGEHTTLRKKVAVKILHHQLSQDDSAIERFRREATTVGEIDNEHILQVLDFGRADDKRLFFAMEYLEGETLARVLEREGKLALPRVIDIVTQVGEALMEAHGLGYVHRDLRPRNVFLTTRKTRADFVKLLDFGLAKLVLPSAEAKQTALGMTFGDPRYMSPEQARGETVDPRADIYSLGVIAFEMLTGAPPFTGSGTFEVLQKHLDAAVPKLRTLRADCPDWLDEVLQHALAKRAEDRFVSVMKLLACVRAQKGPSALEAEERAAKDKLSALKAVGEQLASTAPAPARPAARPAHEPHAKETLMFGAIRPPEPAPVSNEPAKATSGEMSAQPARPAQAANVPSVVVESPSQERTQPERQPAPKVELPSVQLADDAATIPVQKMEPEALAASAPVASAPTPVAATPAPAPVHAPAAAHAPRAKGGHKEPARDRGKDGKDHKEAKEKDHPKDPFKDPKDPTGEWFSDSGQFGQVARKPDGVMSYDDDEFEPVKNRSGVIIGGVIGGLLLVVGVVIALLPKPAHQSTPGESAEPAPTAAQPAAPKPATAPTPTPAPAAAPTPAANPTAAPTPAAPVKPVAPAPAAAAPTPKATPSAPALAVAPKAERPARAEKGPPPIAHEKTAKAEKTDKSEHPKRVAERAPKSLPPGFKDPFAAAPKSSAPAQSAQAEFFIKLGRQKLNAGELGAAASNFQKAREFDARSPDAYAGLGEVAFEQGDYSGAAVHLKQALKLSPSRPRFLLLLGQAYYKLDRPKDAILEYKKALRLDPNNNEAQRSLELAQRKLAGG